MMDDEWSDDDCEEDWSKPACPECGAVDCDRASSSNHKCSSGFGPGRRRVCDKCGRMECPSLLEEERKEA